MCVCLYILRALLPSSPPTPLTATHHHSVWATFAANLAKFPFRAINIWQTCRKIEVCALYYIYVTKYHFMAFWTSVIDSLEAKAAALNEKKWRTNYQISRLCTVCDVLGSDGRKRRRLTTLQLQFFPLLFFFGKILTTVAVAAAAAAGHTIMSCRELQLSLSSIIRWLSIGHAIQQHIGNALSLIVAIFHIACTSFTFSLVLRVPGPAMATTNDKN